MSCPRAIAVIAAAGVVAAVLQFPGGAPTAAQTPAVCKCPASEGPCARWCREWWVNDPRYCKGPAPNCYENAVGKPHARTGLPSTPEDAKYWCSRPRTC
jgi:hypothetical protein